MVIEEPEMFLHPQMQRSLYSSLLHLSEANQVIYSTHSPHFVHVGDFWNILRVTKGPAGTEVTRTNLPFSEKFQEKLRKEVGVERGELFFAKRLLVVEGASESGAIPEYASRLGVDFHRSGGTIVAADGKRNLLDVARVADSLGVVTGVLYDRSSSELKGDPAAEETLNKEIQAFGDGHEDRRVWRMDEDWEDMLRETLGDGEYEKACQGFPGRSKAVRARLIASDAAFPVPDIVKEMVGWLSGNEGDMPHEATDGVEDAAR